MLFVAPRSEWTMLDDWGHTLGLKGSGSNSLVFDGGRIPEYFALPDTQMLDVDNSAGTPGQRLHGNPMYLGRALSLFGLEFIALAVGMVKGALDEYLELITTRTTHRPPIVLRAHDPDYQRWYGHARAKVETAESGDAAGRRAVDAGLPPPGRGGGALRRRGGPSDPVDHARVGAPVLGRAAGVHVPHGGLGRRP
jgi:alkylation response protein AidB-like acyl-CoA dehydrogenase